MLADDRFIHLLQTAGFTIKRFKWTISKGKESVTFSSSISFVLVFEAWNLAGQNSPYLEEQSLPGVKDSSRPGKQLSGSLQAVSVLAATCSLEEAGYLAPVSTIRAWVERGRENTVSLKHRRVQTWETIREGLKHKNKVLELQQKATDKKSNKR